MTVAVNVKGGTNAGTKRPFDGKANPWVHLCPGRPLEGGVVLAGYFARCPSCYTPRPNR